MNRTRFLARCGWSLMAMLAIPSSSGCSKNPPAVGASDGHALREPARQPDPTVGHGFVLHEIGVAGGPLSQQLAAEAKKATSQALKPFAYVGAVWCGPCNAIKHNLDKPLLMEAFHGAYVIKLDLDAWQAQLPGAGLEHPSVPVFFALDASGKPTGRKIDGSAWADDTVENMAPPLKAFFAAK